MKKVLLIAFHFNQTNAVASKRLRGIAKYLPQFGWEPIIIVPKLNNSINEEYKYENLNFKIVETDYEDMVDKWKKKFKNILKGQNDSNLYFNEKVTINNENFTINNENKNNKSNKTQNKLISKSISMAGEIFAYPDGEKYWYEPAMEVSKEIIEINNIKAIISSSWPATSHIIAKDLKNQYNISWIADFRDIWNMNPYLNHTFIRTYFEKKLEIETLQYADVLTTTTNLAKKTLEKLHPNKKIYTITSGFHLEEIVNNYSLDNRENPLKKSEKLNFIYAGLLYGGKRDPTLLFSGIRQLIDEGKIKAKNLELDFYGDEDNLKNLAKKYNIENIVNINGFISHKDVLQKQKESQALVLLSWNNKKEEMFLPGKIFEYLAAKRPVLSIGYKKGSLKDLIKETNIGCHVSTLEETKSCLLKFYNDFSQNKTLNYEGNSEVNKYSIINTSQKFAKLLDSIQNEYN
jgi:glycosyltransferase involved in cell wall biosynthesis